MINKMHDEIVSNLKTAVEQGRSDVVRSLLDVCDKERQGNEESLKLKILNCPVIDDCTPLFYATKLDQADVVRTLLSAGADPGVQNTLGENALDIATSTQMRQIFIDELLRATGNSEVGRVCQLIAAGLNINTFDSELSKNTPLHWAASYGNRDIVSCLITRGANVNAMNSCGATPLHDAISQNEIEIVEELLQGGANPLIQAVRGKFAGRTALDVAKVKPNVLELVEKYTSVNKIVNRRSSISHEINGGILSDISEKMRAASVRSISSEFFDLSDAERKISQTSAPPTTPLNQTVRDTFESNPPFDHVVEKLVRGQLQAPILPLVTRANLQLLWPQPHKVQELAGNNFMYKDILKVHVQPGSVPIHRILDVWEIHRNALNSLGFEVTVGGIQGPIKKSNDNYVIICCVNEHIFSNLNSYQIHITTNKLRVSSASLKSLNSALVTLSQLLQLSSKDEGLGPVLIQDEPQLQHRGILLDISPLSRIPTLDYLFHMIDMLSMLKFSHIHLYTRLRPSTEWQLSYLSSEIVSITRFCEDRFIKVVPVLDVEDCVDLIHLPSMWSAFQSYISSFPEVSLVHVGPRLSSLMLSGKECDLSELSHILTLSPNVTLMLCSNNLSPAVQLPSNVILVEYGFQGDYDFFGRIKQHLDDGKAACLCAGTASWNSLGGCPEAALCNILTAVQISSQNSLLGIIVALWSGPHHLTPYPFAWPGFLIASGLAWNPNTQWEFLNSSLSSLLDAHIFLDTSKRIGKTILELGHADTLALRAARGQSADDPSQLPDSNGSILYCFLTDPDNVALDNLTPEIFKKVTKHIKRCQNNLLQATLNCPYAEMVLQELQLTADLMNTACRIGRTLVSIGLNPNSNMGLSVINLGVCHLPPTFRTDIANKLLAHIEQYRGTWLQRHLPSGLQTSLLILTQALNRFVPNDTNAI